MRNICKAAICGGLVGTVVVSVVFAYWWVLFTGWPQHHAPRLAAGITRVAQTLWFPGSEVGFAVPLPMLARVVLVPVVNWCFYYSVGFVICRGLEKRAKR